MLHGAKPYRRVSSHGTVLIYINVNVKFYTKPENKSNIISVHQCNSKRELPPSGSASDGSPLGFESFMFLEFVAACNCPHGCSLVRLTGRVPCFPIREH